MSRNKEVIKKADTVLVIYVKNDNDITHVF